MGLGLGGWGGWGLEDLRGLGVRVGQFRLLGLGLRAGLRIYVRYREIRVCGSESSPKGELRDPKDLQVLGLRVIRKLQGCAPRGSRYGMASRWREFRLCS